VQLRSKYRGGGTQGHQSDWLAAEQPCGKRLKAALRVWLPHYEKRGGPLAESVRQKVLTISASSIDRLLAPCRASQGARARCGTRPGTLLRKQIPVRTEHDRAVQLHKELAAHQTKLGFTPDDPPRSKSPPSRKTNEPESSSDWPSPEEVSATLNELPARWDCQSNREPVMPRKLPNFIYGAIYRSKSGLSDASASAPGSTAACPPGRTFRRTLTSRTAGYATGSGGSIPASMFHRFRSEKRTSAASSTPKVRRNGSSTSWS
jgi:hypothetical protein